MTNPDIIALSLERAKLVNWQHRYDGYDDAEINARVAEINDTLKGDQR